jgi:glucan biosynthesis protein C
MVMGIVLHTCAALSPEHYWLITYKATAAWADTLNTAIHYFRMPLFFIISGFFTALVILRKGLTTAALDRFVRVLVPFSATLLTLNIVQSFVLNFLDGNNVLPFLNVSHLWFLVNLFVYMFVVFMTHKLLNAIANLSVLSTKFVIYVFVFVNPLIYIAVLSINYVSDSFYTSIPIFGSVFMLLKYLHLFLLGYLIALNSTLFECVLKSTRLFIVLSFCGAIYINFGSLENPSVVATIINEYLTTLTIICTCLSLIGVSYRFLGKANSFMKNLANASYTIYLFHHFLIIIFVALLNYIDYTIPPELVFLSIVVVTYIMTLSLHQKLIVRTPWLLFLFNGKK